MAIQDIIEQLREIGPHVFHDTKDHEGALFHLFRVQDKAEGQGIAGHTAMLALPDSDLGTPLTAKTMAEGKARYAKPRKRVTSHARA